MIGTGVASVVGALPLEQLGFEDGVQRSGAASIGGENVPSSQAITSAPGPVHPVTGHGPIDYGDSGARFGALRSGHVHEGQDIFSRSGTPLIAVRDGVVVDKGNDGGRGNYIAMYSPSTDQTYVYMHMLRPSSLEPGDEVGAGTDVGAMGCTGSCYGTHLHFEVRTGRGIERKPIDPLPILKRWPQVPG
jgi:murein DD-endopeptidase MepM/ murein hydrolase activator NlpD